MNGEDKRGRLFGFGNKSRTSKATRVLETLEADMYTPTKSTATSASDANTKFSKEEVTELLAAERAKFAAERAKIVADIVAQDERHRCEMRDVQRYNEYTQDCFNKLFKAHGRRPPRPPPMYKVSN